MCVRFCLVAGACFVCAVVAWLFCLLVCAFVALLNVNSFSFFLFFVSVAFVRPVSCFCLVGGVILCLLSFVDWLVCLVVVRLFAC